MAVNPLDQQANDDMPMQAAEPLASWIISHVREWEEWRDENYRPKWDEYYRIWRGIWSQEDKSRNSERARIISPATTQAVESTVAELEESTFARKRWIDVEDDIKDEEPDAELYVRQLLEDFKKANVEGSISECYLNGALYGKGIAKIAVSKGTKKTLEEQPFIGGAEIMVNEADDIYVKLIPVDPRNFAIDPVARNIDEALGMAHSMVMPKHVIMDKIESGYYNEVDLGHFKEDQDFLNSDETNRDTNMVKIVEYHGFVPREYLEDQEGEFEEIFDEEDGESTAYTDEDDLVEAIVTVANDAVILKAVENPFLMKDRCFIAYSHDIVPNRFYGRGVVEKAYNSQKALDAELRARMDALALSTYPMMGVDATRVPRGSDFKVRPGKNLFMNGNPAEALMPLKFPPPDPQTYHFTADLERMIQMGTGAMDSATPVGMSPRNQTATGMSMIHAGMIKRTKRTMQNISRDFLGPFVEKALWRYMQFAPDKYPKVDLKFKVVASMGIMAREFEQQNIAQLMNTVPPGSPAYWMLMKSMYQNSSLESKEEMLQIVDQMLQQSMQPQEQEPDLNGQASMLKAQLEAQIAPIKTDLDKAEYELKRMDRALKARELDLKEGDQQIEWAKVRSESTKDKAESILHLAKAEAEELGSQLDLFKNAMQSIHKATKLEPGVYEDGAGQLFNIKTDGMMEDLNGESSGEAPSNSSES